MYATCETEGCGNAYVPVPLPDDYGAVICGPCGSKITNVSDVAPEPITEVPEWLL